MRLKVLFEWISRIFMKYLFIITGMIALLSACIGTTPPSDEQEAGKETRESDSYSEDKGVPAVVP